MSYLQFQQQCEDCGEKWNAAFGMVNTTIIAEPPKACPMCGSTSITKMADGWTANPLFSNLAPVTPVQLSDTELLDWLGEHHEFDIWYGNNGDSVSLSVDDRHGILSDKLFKAPSLRDAIRAAMKAQSANAAKSQPVERAEKSTNKEGEN